MIDLTQPTTDCQSMQIAPCDPGTKWITQSVAIDAPPDSDSDPAPDACWSADAVRTGLCGAVSPRVVALQSSGYRMYYTQILPRVGSADGANDYDNATSRILSAISSDGTTWTPEPGVRLSAQQGGAGTFRVASAEVVPCNDGSGQLRMYYECCEGPQSQQNSIRSAVSHDGLVWTVEPATRFQLHGRNLLSPRIMFLGDHKCRLYCSDRDQGIISAMSHDGGLTFEFEPGLRIAANGPFDGHTAFAPEIMRLHGGGYRMYYAGYSDLTRADILTATSADGLHWQKASEPVLSPGSKPWDAAKCSEMCVIWKPNATTSPADFRMFYEACDGTTPDRRGVWRIAAAVCRQ